MNPEAREQVPEPVQHLGQSAVQYADGDQATPQPQTQQPQPQATSSQPATQPHPDNKTIKLPVATSVVPALIIGLLIVVLLLAVGAYALLG